MTRVWAGRIGERRVEVRRAGSTLRLTVDGVLHTAWNERLGVTGSVWDPLAFAALLAPRPRSVLLLGVGGGAAIRLLRRHVGPERIVAVEREAVLARVARRWFRVGGDDVDLVVDDALAWVATAPPGAPRFDVVVDDLFHEACGEPVRSAGGTAWWRALAERVAPDGVLVVNFADLRTFRRSALAADAALRRRFPAALRFSCPGFTNAIVAYHSGAETAATLRRRIAALPTLSAAARRRLTFRVHAVPRGA